MSFLLGNAVVGQSGGPTSAINATLSGVIRECLNNSDKIKTLYGMKNGIEGFLREDFVNLSVAFKNTSDLSLLENTPASALGSCRVRLPDIDSDDTVYKKIFEIFKKYDIKYFFYIGGNDSMDTVKRLSDCAKRLSIDVRIIGIPKTIDNDILCTDHTPGFGSSAKYVSTAIHEIVRDCSVYTKKAVTIVELMGRDAGWLTSSASLPKAIFGRGVDYIYLPEREFSKKHFISDLEKAFLKHNDLVVAVSEGIKYSSGRYVSENAELDAFGHKSLCGTAHELTRIVKRELGCKTRAIELNLPQRCSAHILSATDISESVRAGKYAVKRALLGENGKMVSLVRANNNYRISFDMVDASLVANGVKRVPSEFINEEGNYVTDACIEYLMPLIRGERKIAYKDGLPVHFVLD